MPAMIGWLNGYPPANGWNRSLPHSDMMVIIIIRLAQP